MINNRITGSKRLLELLKSAVDIGILTYSYCKFVKYIIIIFMKNNIII